MDGRRAGSMGRPEERVSPGAPVRAQMRAERGAVAVASGERGDSPIAWIDVDGQRLPAWIEHGQVRVELPFDVDFVRLAHLLQEDGYFYAHHPERVDAQGWGRRLDPEGYYPYWVWRESRRPDGGYRTIFGCPPEDYRWMGERAEATGAGSPEPVRPPGPARAASPAATAGHFEVAALEPVVGPAALAEIGRWVPYLRRAARNPGG